MNIQEVFKNLFQTPCPRCHKGTHVKKLWEKDDHKDFLCEKCHVIFNEQGDYSEIIG